MSYGLPVAISPAVRVHVNGEEDGGILSSSAKANTDLGSHVESSGDSSWDVGEESVEGNEEVDEGAGFELRHQCELHDLGELDEGGNIEAGGIVSSEIDHDHNLDVGGSSVNIALSGGIIWGLLELRHGSFVEVGELCSEVESILLKSGGLSKMGMGIKVEVLLGKLHAIDIGDCVCSVAHFSCSYLTNL